MAEISSSLTVEEFMKRMPDTDASGVEIPAWKKQMLARKAVDKARKEAEEELKRQLEERKAKAIPAWKRQILMAKQDPSSSFR